MVTEAVREEVFACIERDRELLAETCLELGNTFGPCGHEQPVADAVSAWYARHGMPSFQQRILPERSNVVARVPGAGGGRSLVFNAHLDTEISGLDHRQLMESDDPNLVGAWREADRLFGHTVLNDRGCMSVFMVMGKALRDAGAPLAGDVVLTSVAGETGMAPVDEYEGMSYDGKGFGSKYLVDHGVRGDYALVAETTSWSMSWVECGSVYLKITTRGRNMYTPRLLRGTSVVEQPNALVRGAALVAALEEWAVDYEERNAFRSPCGDVRPKAQVGAIRGGVPYRPNRSSTVCKLYMDVRTVPGGDQDAVIDEVRRAARQVDPQAEVECYMAKQGLIGTGVEPLADAISAAYDSIIGGPTPDPEIAATSMWRDTNVFNAVGIPSITFGPSRGSAAVQGTGHFDLDDLVAAAKIYALIALDLCRVSHIAGPLHLERLGPEGRPMVFIHPNPMDTSCWMYQMAHFSTWYRTIGIDLPGYGRSPRASAGVTMEEIADACWEAVDRAANEPAILVGCSVGAWIAPYMEHVRPGQVLAMVLTGVGYSPDKEFARRRIASYAQQGVAFRREHTYAVLSRSFGETPMAAYLADLFCERNDTADGPTIVEMFRALEQPDPDWLWSGIGVPTLVITGTEDNAHPRALVLPDHIPDCELVVMDGAGHACNLERPWEFDAAMIDFLARRGL